MDVPGDEEQDAAGRDAPRLGDGLELRLELRGEGGDVKSEEVDELGDDLRRQKGRSRRIWHVSKWCGG